MIPKVVRIVLDTNVLVSALRSRNGASATIVGALPWIGYELALSVPLYLEYQDVLTRPGMIPAVYSAQAVQVLCRYLASIAHLQDVHFLWRSFLPDPKDDLLLELAVAAGAGYIVTHNVRHFHAAASFGVRALAPGGFLRLLKKQQ